MFSKMFFLRKGLGRGMGVHPEHVTTATVRWRTRRRALWPRCR